MDFTGFTQQQLNLLESWKIPEQYYKTNNLAYLFWFRSLLQKIDSSILFKNLPSGWSNDYLMFCLWVRGFVGIFESFQQKYKKYSDPDSDRIILFSAVNLAGQDFYYQPDQATIINPIYTRTEPFVIGKDIEILKLTPDFCGCIDIIYFYASKLAELSKSIDMAIENAKTPLILSANNEAQAATLKKVYDKIQAGESLIIFDDTTETDEIIPKKEPFNAWINELKQNFILLELLESMQNLLDDFYKEIGIPVSIEKKERLVTTEADFSIAQSQARISCWAETLKESLDRINEKYGLNIEVEYASENNDSRDGELPEQSEQEYN